MKTTVIELEEAAKKLPQADLETLLKNLATHRQQCVEADFVSRPGGNPKAES